MTVNVPVPKSAEGKLIISRGQRAGISNRDGIVTGGAARCGRGGQVCGAGDARRGGVVAVDEAREAISRARIGLSDGSAKVDRE